MGIGSLSSVLDSYQNFAFAYVSTSSKVKAKASRGVRLHKICVRGDLFEDLFPIWLSKLDFYWQKEQPGRYSVLKKRMQVLKRYSKKLVCSGAFSYKLIEKAYSFVLSRHHFIPTPYRRLEYHKTALGVYLVFLNMETEFALAQSRVPPNLDPVDLNEKLKILANAIDDFISEIIFQEVQKNWHKYLIKKLRQVT
jgi:hypothetical protein